MLSENRYNILVVRGSALLKKEYAFEHNLPAPSISHP
jgi:hypothetical protein